MDSNQIRVWNYCDYSSDNYGSSRAVQIGDIELYFSYQTVIAFRAPQFGLVIRKNVWSTSTGKHLNAINDDKKIRINGDEFEQKLAEMLKGYNFVKVA